MTKDEALKIIKEENLMGYKFFDDTDSGYDEVGIIKNGDQWEVFSTDERGYLRGVRNFNSESDALDSFIDRLRAGNEYLRSPYQG